MNIDHHARIQRRELRDYQQFFMLLNNLDMLSEESRKAFVCITGPVWMRFNAATKGASERRIIALFLSNELNGFDALLFVGCAYVQRQEQRCQILWNGHPLGKRITATTLHRLTTELAGRSVLRISDLGLVDEIDAVKPASVPARRIGHDLGCTSSAV